MKRSSTPGVFEIAPEKLNTDWVTLAPTLVGADEATWKLVVKEYFWERLDSRYLKPIEAIQEMKRRKGEGFSMVALQCSLIEFLEGCFSGKNYVRKNPVPPKEYNESGKIFADFLTIHPPFAKQFTDARLASEFYRNIRCGILHEARTYGPWIVGTSSSAGTIIDFTAKILYRDDFQDALMIYIKEYMKDLAKTRVRQDAFIEKYNALAKA